MILLMSKNKNATFDEINESDGKMKMSKNFRLTDPVVIFVYKRS